MPTFQVNLQIEGEYIYRDIEAEDEDHAIDIAYEKVESGEEPDDLYINVDKSTIPDAY